MNDPTPHTILRDIMDHLDKYPFEFTGTDGFTEGYGDEYEDKSTVHLLLHLPPERDTFGRWLSPPCDANFRLSIERGR